MRCVALFFSLLFINSLAQAGESWRSLFDGKDLRGWETYISEQPAANAYKPPMPTTSNLRMCAV